MKIVYYEAVKVTINVLGLAKVILDVVVQHQDLSHLIVSDKGLLFTLKFWSSLCYFLGIKQKLSIAFHLQIDGQTERQNSKIEAYFRAFVNFKQNNWARLLPMAEFVYNNAKNVSIGYILFKLNCRYHPRISFKKDVDFRSKWMSASELLSELQKLMSIYCENLFHS